MKNSIYLRIAFLYLAVIVLAGCEKENEVTTPEVILPETIKYIQKPNDIYVTYGAPHNLPQKIEIILDNDEKIKVPVEWDGYFNPIKPGEYLLNGNLFLKHLNLKCKDTSIHVTVSVNDAISYTLSTDTGKLFLGDGYDTRDYSISRLAIKTEELSYSQKHVDEFEYFFKLIDSEEERLKNYNQFLEILGPWPSMCKTALKENEIGVLVAFIYRYKTYYIDSEIQYTDAALDKLNKSYEEFVYSYGDCYLHGTTLSKICAYELTIEMKENTWNESILDLYETFSIVNDSVVLSPEYMVMGMNILSSGFEFSDFDFTWGVFNEPVSKRFKEFKKRVRESKNSEDYVILYPDYKIYPGSVISKIDN